MATVRKVSCKDSVQDEEHRLNGLPLERAVKRIFEDFLALDSRKAWNVFVDPSVTNIHDFVLERGFRDDTTDAVIRDNASHFRLVFEVKSHASHGATIGDLRQLEDWIGRLDRAFQGTLTDEALAKRLGADTSLNGPVNKVERLCEALHPWKGVFVINHKWDQATPESPFGHNEIKFAKERNFCLLDYRDLLHYRDIVRTEIVEAYWVLEEICLTAGQLHFHSSEWSIR
jgi:hypothetical protein